MRYTAPGVQQQRPPDSTICIALCSAAVRQAHVWHQRAGQPEVASMGVLLRPSQAQNHEYDAPIRVSKVTRPQTLASLGMMCEPYGCCSALCACCINADCCAAKACTRCCLAPDTTMLKHCWGLVLQAAEMNCEVMFWCHAGCLS